MSDLEKAQQWIKKQAQNPRDPYEWVKIWMWIALCAFFCGGVISATYYNLEMIKRTDQFIEDAKPYCPNLWVHSVDVHSMPVDIYGDNCTDECQDCEDCKLHFIRERYK